MARVREHEWKVDTGRPLERSLLLVGIHEAGHAVAALAMGQPVLQADLSHCAPWFVADPPYDGRVWPSTHADLAVVIFAGPIAEEYLMRLPVFGVGGSGLPDLVAISKLGLSLDDRRLARSRARSIVARNETAIARLAGALIRDPEIKEPQARAAAGPIN